MPQVRTRYGTISVPVPDLETDVIGRFLRYYGEWAWLEVAFVSSLLPSGARVLDLGAFVGTFGLGLSAHMEVSYVCFAEANPTVVPFLETNARGNGRLKSDVIHALVKGAGSLENAGHAEPGNLGSLSFVAGATGDVDVPAPVKLTTLNQLNADFGPFSLVKMDVEGAEFDILRNDLPLLTDSETLFWIECNEHPRSLELANLLLTTGRNVFYFAYPSHNPQNFRKREAPIYPWGYEAGLLATWADAVALPQALEGTACILQQIFNAEDLRKVLWVTPRWGMEEWYGHSLPSVVAMASHTLRGEHFQHFLQAGWSPGELVWERLERLQLNLNAAASVAAELDAKTAAISRLEESLAAASKDHCATIHKLEEGLETALKERDELRLALTETARQLRESEASLLERLADSGRAMEQLEEAQKRLAALAELADRVEDLEVEVVRLKVLEEDDLPRMHATVRNLEGQVNFLSGRSHTLDVVTSSTTWRIARRVHLLIARMPLLKAVLVKIRKAAGHIRRSLRW